MKIKGCLISVLIPVMAIIAVIVVLFCIYERDTLNTNNAPMSYSERDTLINAENLKIICGFKIGEKRQTALKKLSYPDKELFSLYLPIKGGVSISNYDDDKTVRVYNGYAKADELNNARLNLVFCADTLTLVYAESVDEDVYQAIENKYSVGCNYTDGAKFLQDNKTRLVYGYRRMIVNKDYSYKRYYLIYTSKGEKTIDWFIEWAKAKAAAKDSIKQKAIKDII